MRHLPVALIGLGLAIVFTQEVLIAILGASVTILTTLAILLSNARTRRQEALQSYTLALVEDCDSMRKRISSLESELRIAHEVIMEWQEKYLQCLHEQQGNQREPARLPSSLSDPIPSLDLDQDD